MIRIGRIVLPEEKISVVEKVSPTVLKIYLGNKEPKFYEFPSEKSLFIAYKNLQLSLRDSHIIKNKIIIMKRRIMDIYDNGEEYVLTVKHLEDQNREIRFKKSEDYDHQLENLYNEWDTFMSEDRFKKNFKVWKNAVNE